MFLTIKEPTSQNTRLCQKSAIQTGELSASFNNFPDSEHWRGTILVKRLTIECWRVHLILLRFQVFLKLWLAVSAWGLIIQCSITYLLAWQCFPKISTRAHSISFLTLTVLNVVYVTNCYQRFINPGTYSYVLW